MGEAVKIDKKNREITLGNGDRVGYDYLILGVGARHSYFGKDEWEQFAPGLKTLQDALKLREKILFSFEKAERCDSISEAKKYLNFVIIGGGPTGVELAGAISEIAYDTMLKNFRRIDVKKTKIYLIEGSSHILPVYPENLAKTAQKYLENFGVNVLAGKRVTEITEEGVHIEDTFIKTTNIIWAAGTQASPLLKQLEAKQERAGRVHVDPDLSLPDHPEIFVIGDAAAVEGPKGASLPALAPVAIQEGKFVADIIKKNIPKGERPAFRYKDKGSMATIGKTKAIGMFGKLQFKGFIAWLAWCFVHIMYLVGFRNRFLVVSQWLFAYYTQRRGARLINRSIEEELPQRSDH